MFMVVRKGDRFNLCKDDGASADQDGVILVSAPVLRGDPDGPTVAALVRVAGDLLVAEYENQHIILNDAARAKAQALAFAEGFNAMTGHIPSAGCMEAIGAPAVGGRVTHAPCGKCGHIIPVGQSCLTCELLDEEAKEKQPSGQ